MIITVESVEIIVAQFVWYFNPPPSPPPPPIYIFDEIILKELLSY